MTERKVTIGHATSLGDVVPSAAAAVMDTPSKDKKEDLLRAASAAAAAAAAVDTEDEEVDESDKSSASTEDEVGSDSDDNDDEFDKVDERKEASTSKVDTKKRSKNSHIPRFFEHLIRHHQVELWVSQKHWNSPRNQHEALTQAMAIDALKDPKKEKRSLRIMVGRLQALRFQDVTKNWAVAQQFEQVQQVGAELVTTTKALRAALKLAELYKKVSKAGSHKSKQEDEDDEADEASK
jgi:hypothetical protein